MGIGGMLMWTIVAKEIYKKYNKKAVFIIHKKILTPKEWINNPYISFTKNTDTIDCNLSSYNAGLEWSENKQHHSSVDRCLALGITPPTNICPVLEYTEKETQKIKNLLKQLPEKFVCIEPNAKTDWSVNRGFPFDKWQNIVDKLVEQNIPVVQVSMPNKKLLNNVIDFRTKLSSFRECACLLKYSSLFISTDGGLMHASAANKNKCFVICSPMLNPVKTLYNSIDYVWIHSDKHKACNMIKKCSECEKLVNNFDEYSIVDKILKIYNE